MQSESGGDDDAELVRERWEWQWRGLIINRLAKLFSKLSRCCHFTAYENSCLSLTHSFSLISL